VRGGDESSSGPPRVFINYRRDDAAGHAGRLYDALAARFGADQVFMDVDAIRPGENFAAVLDESVGQCDVLIALIGKRWTSATDREGRRRLERPEDYVRLELQTALASDRTRVIPALVQGAEMPSSDELPQLMRELAMRQAIELSDVRWRSDVDRLIRSLEGVSGDAPPQPPSVPPEHGGRRRTAVIAAPGALAVAAAALAVVLAGSGSSDSGKTSGAAAKGTSTSTASGTPRKKPVAHATQVRYRPYATDGYQAQIPNGSSWSQPAQTSFGGGRRVRTAVVGPSGAFVAIDYTPRDKPTFSAAFQSKTSVVLAAIGPATRYVFKGGGVAQCDRWRCVDYQVDVPGTAGGLGVVAGGPDFSLTTDLARTVAESLTPSGSG